MSIADRVGYDIECMRDYFARLFSFVEASAKNPRQSVAEAAQFVPHGIAYFVRPDMVCNVYGLVDFWLGQLCLYHERRSSLSVTFDAFRNAKRKCSDLQRYRNYLANVASLNLSPVENSFSHINSLREVRNIFIHGGGHVSAKKYQMVTAIADVSIRASLVVVTDQFVWQSLEHACKYLLFVAEA